MEARHKPALAFSWKPGTSLPSPSHGSPAQAPAPSQEYSTKPHSTWSTGPSLFSGVPSGHRILTEHSTRLTQEYSIGPHLLTSQHWPPSPHLHMEYSTRPHSRVQHCALTQAAPLMGARHKPALAFSWEPGTSLPSPSHGSPAQACPRLLMEARHKPALAFSWKPGTSLPSPSHGSPAQACPRHLPRPAQAPAPSQEYSTKPHSTWSTGPSLFSGVPSGHRILTEHGTRLTQEYSIGPHFLTSTWSSALGRTQEYSTVL